MDFYPMDFCLMDFYPMDFCLMDFCPTDFWSTDFYRRTNSQWFFPLQTLSWWTFALRNIARNILEWFLSVMFELCWKYTSDLFTRQTLAYFGLLRQQSGLDFQRWLPRMLYCRFTWMVLLFERDTRVSHESFGMPATTRLLQGAEAKFVHFEFPRNFSKSSKIYWKLGGIFLIYE